MYRLLALLIGYAIGSIQTAYIVGKSSGIDIRDYGSKNAGMTNVTRTLGKKAGAFVFVADILKGISAFVIATLIFSDACAFWWFRCRCTPFVEYGMVETRLHFLRHILPGIYAGLGAVLGHCFPVWLKFRGGKGVSSTLGLIVMIDPIVALIAFGAGFVAVAATRYISLASLVITLLVPILMIFSGFEIEAVALMAGVAALIWFLHRENIKRLISGNERKFLSKK